MLLFPVPRLPSIASLSPPPQARAMALVLALILMVASSSGCVTEGVPLAYARSAFPECENHTVMAHRLAESSHTNVTMNCPPDGLARAVAIKCKFGFGILANTTCHENN